MPKKTASKPLQIAPEDYLAAQQLATAIAQVEELPFEDQWPVILELLPESMLVYVIKSQSRKPDEMFNLYGLLALTLLRQWLKEEGDLDTDLLTVLIYGISTSIVAEMEKRRKRFCKDVIHMSNPLDFDFKNPVTLIPKGEEPVTLRMLTDYYVKEANG